MVKTPAVLLIVLLLAIVGLSLSSIASVDKTINVTATVSPVSNFSVTLFPSLTNTTYDWNHTAATMAFGNLVNANASDPSSALTSNTGYLAYVAVTNNNGVAYHVDFQGAPLTHTDATTKLENNAFVVSAGPHYYANNSVATINTAGLTTAKHSAGATAAYTVFSSNTAGQSDSFDMFFGLTGDPKNAVSNTSGLIPPTQKSGTYSATLHVTLYP
jgi:hypothetical protein